jgi:hypothetical protein
LAKRALLALAMLGACALAPAAAHAGTYDVYSCTFGGSVYGNNAWAAVNNSGAGDPSYTVPDATCAERNDPLVALMRPGNPAVPTVAYAPGISSALNFALAPDTRISDFTLSLRHWFSTPGNVGFTLLVFGANGVTLTGNYDPFVVTYVNNDKRYFGGGGPVDTGAFSLSKADSLPAQQQGTATALTLYAGCWGGSPGCTFDQNSIAQLHLIGSRVTVEDLRPPILTGVKPATGLLAPGVRSGDEPITFSASDNSGIRYAEIVDVTDAANPVVVASEDYDTERGTDAKTRCNFTKPRPCPDVKDETIAASPAIGGRRTVLLRVTDAGGETAVSAPFSIVARGPLNGVNGGDGARLVAGFPARVYRGKGKDRRRVYVLRPSRLTSYGKGATMRGILRNAAGQPIPGADLRILVREDRLGSNYVDRGSVATGPDGRFQLNLPKGSSRLLRLGYRAYKGDDAFVARSSARLNVRARISVRGPRRVRARGRATFTGRLVGRPFPPRGVTLDLQIFQPGRGWRVFGTTRTRKNGRFVVRYRFNSASSGRFTFRLRLRPNDAYPYARGFSRRVRVRVG